MTAASGDPGETPHNARGFPPGVGGPGDGQPARQGRDQPAHDPAHGADPAYLPLGGPPGPPPHPLAGPPAPPAGYPPAPPVGYPGIPPVGYPGIPPGYGYYWAGHPAAPPTTNTLAILSVVASVVGMFCVVSSIPGIVLGAVAISQINRTRQEGRGLAVAGIVLGTAGLVTYLALLAFARG